MFTTHLESARPEPLVPSGLGVAGLRVLFGLWVVLSPGLAAAAPQTRPNIVFILVDDLGWSDVACYGNRLHRTPHLDRLANEGLQFLEGYAPAPICSASRASIVTGKAVPRLGFEFVTKHSAGHQQLDTPVPLQTPPYTLNLPLVEQTLAERLQAVGYRTAFAGKWHLNQHYQGKYLAWDPRFGPQQQGFSVGIDDFGSHPYGWRKGQPAKPTSPQTFPQDSLVDAAADFIRAQRKEQPYFLMVSTYFVHTPVKNRVRWLVDEYAAELGDAPAANRQRRLEYAAFVETLDRHIGQLVNAVDSSQQANNTLVLLMSDNGGHPEYTSNAPLRGSKWNLYEGGIRVPWLARWKGHIAPGQSCSVPVIGYDLLPTFCELAGCPRETASTSADSLDGRSLAPLLAAPHSPVEPRELIWHFPYYHPESTYSQAQNKIGVGDFAVSKTKPQSALRWADYKLLKFAEDQRCELYDLASDRAEQIDLSLREPELTAQLEARLEQRLAAMNARRAVPQIPIRP